jgi:hypothetical protein
MTSPLQRAAGVIDALSDDPLLDASSIQLLTDCLAGEVDTTAWTHGKEAAVVGLEYRTTIPLAFDPSRLLGVPATRLGPRWLVLGTPLRFRHTLYGAPARVAELLADIELEAAALGFDGLAVPWVPSGDPMLEVLAGLGYHSAFLDADWYLDMHDARSVDAVIDALPRTPRRQFRNDRNHFAATDTTMRPWLPADKTATTSMHLAFMRDHGHTRPELDDATPGRFARSPRGSARVAVDHTESPVGFVLTLQDQRATHVLRWGRPQGHVPDRLYANLGYLDPIAQAVAHGSPRVWFGKSAHRFKRLRGLTPVTASLHVRALNASLHRDLRRSADAADLAARRRFNEAMTG